MFTGGTGLVEQRPLSLSLSLVADGIAMVRVPA